MMFLVIWIGFEDLDWIGFDSLQVDWIWIWIVACRDWIDSTKLDWIFGFYQPLHNIYSLSYQPVVIASDCHRTDTRTWTAQILWTKNPWQLLSSENCEMCCCVNWLENENVKRTSGRGVWIFQDAFHYQDCWPGFGFENLLIFRGVVFDEIYLMKLLQNWRIDLLISTRSIVYRKHPTRNIVL